MENTELGTVPKRAAETYTLVLKLRNKSFLRNPMENKNPSRKGKVFGLLGAEEEKVFEGPGPSPATPTVTFRCAKKKSTSNKVCNKREG